MTNFTDRSYFRVCVFIDLKFVVLTNFFFNFKVWIFNHNLWIFQILTSFSSCVIDLICFDFEIKSRRSLVWIQRRRRKKMNHCNFPQNAAFMSREETMGFDCNDLVVCPKPRRVGVGLLIRPLRLHMRYKSFLLFLLSFSCGYNQTFKLTLFVDLQSSCIWFVWYQSWCWALRHHS